MFVKLEVKCIGNSTGLILPQELLGQLSLAQGDWPYLTEHADGSVRLSPYDPAFEKGLKTAEKAMKICGFATGKLDEDGLTRWIRDSWPAA